MSAHAFDAVAFYTALDAVRSLLGLSWRQVAATTGLTPSTFTRLGAGHTVDAHALVTLAIWADMDLRWFARKAATA